MAKACFPNLFKPIEINSLTIKNRIVMPAMDTGYAADDHSVSKRLIDYHVARARGGVGLNILEFTSVHPEGRAMFNQVGIWDDKFIPGLTKLADEVHAAGGRICLQLHHAGRESNQTVTGVVPSAPSAVASGRSNVLPREMSKVEIEGMVESFAEAANRAKTAGFDAVEVHGAHGYLLGQFMSGAVNKRTDEFGGSLENRVRFPMQVIRRVREVVGPEFPILFRVSGEEYVPGGLTLEDSKKIAVMAVAVGADAINVSAGVIASFYMIIAPTALEPGFNVYTAEGIKQVVNVPVITVGRINNPELAESIVLSGKADMVAIGRGSLADPEFSNKAARGDADLIRRCIACQQGCDNEPLTCSQNPWLGREAEEPKGTIQDPKKVLVVGGGPAGLEAAVTAARVGHNVILMEKSKKLGGQIILASVPPFKAEVFSVVQSRVSELAKLEVEIQTGTEVTAEIVSQIAPDVVIVATGAIPSLPKIPGIDNSNVVTAWDVLAGKATAGQQVAIIGGGKVGCETADYLAEFGKQVTIIEIMPEIASDVKAQTKFFMNQRFEKNGVKVLTNAKVLFIEDDGIKLEVNGCTQKSQNFETIVIASGSIPQNSLAAEFEQIGIKTVIIGDALEPRGIREAVKEGAEVLCICGGA